MFAITCVLSVVATFLLPETVRRPLTDTIEEVQKRGLNVSAEEIEEYEKTIAEKRARNKPIPINSGRLYEECNNKEMQDNIAFSSEGMTKF